jgi:nitrite reductase/ring-hydroxylating ferredoxin subunit
MNWRRVAAKYQTRLEDAASLADSRGMSLLRVCSMPELAPGQARRIDDPPVAVFNVNGTFFAIRDVCTHEEAPLSEGEVVEEETLVCPWHGACFSLRTGEALTPPAIEPVKTYPVVLREDDIYVELDDKETNDR